MHLENLKIFYNIVIDISSFLFTIVICGHTESHQNYRDNIFSRPNLKFVSCYFYDLGTEIELNNDLIV